MEEKTKDKEEFYDDKILSNILNFNVNLDQQLNTKANFIYGASTVLLLFVLNKVLSSDFQALSALVKLAWVVLLGGSFVSFILAVFIVIPKPKFLSKKERIKDDVIYYKNIIKFFSRNEYVQCLSDLPSDKKRVNSAYANQIYSLSENVIPYKARLLKNSGWILVYSIIVMNVLLLISAIVYSTSLLDLFV